MPVSKANRVRILGPHQPRHRVRHRPVSIVHEPLGLGFAGHDQSGQAEHKGQGYCWKKISPHIHDVHPWLVWG